MGLYGRWLNTFGKRLLPSHFCSKTVALYYSESLVTTCKAMWFRSPEGSLNHIQFNDVFFDSMNYIASNEIIKR